jgi:glycosyltransferase involved in cell wall biosynthesis
MNPTFRFHVLALPHTSINKEYNCCAYSQKLLKFIAMMAPRGHALTLYSNEGADVDCENVEILSEKERARWFGPNDPQKPYDLKWLHTEPYWQRFNDRCVEALRPRLKKGDFIVTASGHCAQSVGDAIPGSYYGVWQTAALVEAFIGYYGTFSRYRIYESHSHREWMMGRADCRGEDNDTAVVPNYWDMQEFQPVARPTALGGVSLTEPYFLFIGRVILDKGYDIAIEIVKSIPGARLILAGQGDPGPIPNNVVRFGRATVEERNVLMQHAIATICPTRFREPFGGTAAESQLCGTPAITTDQGAFTETVTPIWRCASHRDFVAAAKRAMGLTPAERAAIRERAVGLWSFDAVAPKFEAYFQRIMDRWGAGWYAEEPYVMPLSEEA